ncbi:MAG TPA: Swt1 family HEPN domain-containing protein [Gemmatimonadales bacterium]|nr:Swt1 family HEPN domain-containing protein [Gemmatimonadales bacterium]
MDTKTAQAVLAHQRGIPLHRYLDREAVAEVQRVLPLLNGAAASAAEPAHNAKAVARRGRGRAAGPAKARRIVFADGFDYEDPILPEAKLHEAREMAAVYPMLYVLENSMRELVKTVMQERHGVDWWDTALTSRRARSAKAKADSRRTGENNRRWHQRRGAHPIDYTDLSDLGELILAKREDFFPDVLGGGDSAAWFEQFMRELEPSRNVVCHMNPLSAPNVSDVGVKLHRWQETLRNWEHRRLEQQSLGATGAN